MPGKGLIHFGSSGDKPWIALCGWNDMTSLVAGVISFSKSKVTCPECLEAYKAQAVVRHAQNRDKLGTLEEAAGAQLDALASFFGMSRHWGETDAELRERARREIG